LSVTITAQVYEPKADTDSWQCETCKQYLWVIPKNPCCIQRDPATSEIC